MWRTLGLPLMIGVLAAVAWAQETPRVEVSAGGSYAREAIGNLRYVNAVGWDGSVFENVNNWFSAGIDISGYFSSPKVNLGLPTPTPISSRAFTYLFGPRFSRRQWIHLKPYAEALVGVENLRITPKFAGMRRTVSLTSFAGAFGGGLDVPINSRFTVRLIQADYMLTRFRKFDTATGAFDGAHAMQNNIRASAGIVLNFGQR
jgi:hypothetical protein